VSKKYHEQMEARRPLAQRVDPHLYEVVYLFERREAVDCLRARERVSSPVPARIKPMEGRTGQRSKDRMAKSYRVNTFARINNIMISSLLRLGIKVWSFSLLTVRGRKSGKPIVTPIAVFVQDQKRYLVAPYGVVNWVRNLRAAAGVATLTWRRHSERIHVIELEPVAAAPIFRAALRSGPPGIPAVIFRLYRSLWVLPYLGVTEHSSLEEFEREVLTHPVFLVQSALEQAGEQAGEASP
jgi:hypothetical protein